MRAQRYLKSPHLTKYYLRSHAPNITPKTFSAMCSKAPLGQVNLGFKQCKTVARFARTLVQFTLAQKGKSRASEGWTLFIVHSQGVISPSTIFSLSNFLVWANVLRRSQAAASPTSSSPFLSELLAFSDSPFPSALLMMRVFAHFCWVRKALALVQSSHDLTCPRGLDVLSSTFLAKTSKLLQAL